jgi:hypothetical protein
MKGPLIAILAMALIAPALCIAGDEVTLMIPEVEKEGRGATSRWVVNSDSAGNAARYVEMGLATLVSRLENDRYKVDAVELWVEGAAEGGNKLFISLQGKGGCKIVLTPRR